MDQEYAVSVAIERVRQGLDAMGMIVCDEHTEEGVTTLEVSMKHRGQPMGIRITIQG